MSVNAGYSGSRFVSFLTQMPGACSSESGLSECSAISDAELSNCILSSLLRALLKQASGSWFSAPYLLYSVHLCHKNLPLPGTVGYWAKSASCMWIEKSCGLKIACPLQFVSLRKSWHHPIFESPFRAGCRRRAPHARILALSPFLQNLAPGE